VPAASTRRGSLSSGGDQAWLRNIPFKLDIMQAEEKGLGHRQRRRLAFPSHRRLHPPRYWACQRHQGAAPQAAVPRTYTRPVCRGNDGREPADNPSVTRRVAIGQRLAAAIRREGRRDIQVLRRIQEELTSEGIERTLIRIFDGILWYSHPAAGVPGSERDDQRRDSGLRTRELPPHVDTASNNAAYPASAASRAEHPDRCPRQRHRRVPADRA
jgi:hypothetical protein